MTLQYEPSWPGARISGPPSEDNPHPQCISCQRRRHKIPPHRYPHKLQRRPGVTERIGLTIRPPVLFLITDNVCHFLLAIHNQLIAVDHSIRDERVDLIGPALLYFAGRRGSWGRMPGGWAWKPSTLRQRYSVWDPRVGDAVKNSGEEPVKPDQTR